MLKLLITVSFVITVLAQDWDRHSLLDTDGKYHLYWTVKEDVIVFQVEVAATGWVGFGISPNGGMAGSDVVIGWVSNGTTTFHDRHAKGKLMPIIDENQDWELLWSHENDTHTLIRFQRELDTCDKDGDLVIKRPTTRVIYAYSQEDPSSASSVMYHGTINRGSKSLNLFEEEKENLGSPEDLFYWDIKSINVKIPHETDTSYLCTIIKRPSLGRLHHVTKIEPIVQPGNERFVHHIALYECAYANESVMEPLLKGYHSCYTEDIVQKFNFCFPIIAAWAVGGEAIYLPEYTGLSFGRDDFVYYNLEIHYDNPGYVKGIIDNSGLRFTYTPKLRRYDSSILTIGNLWYSCMLIPPKQKDFIVSGHAHPDCLKKSLPSTGIKIFGAMLHTHLTGKKLKLRHFRGKEELPTVCSDENYDFNYQNTFMLPEERVVLPDDHLILECDYDTLKRQNTTFGGLSTHQEMCLAFLYYYPEVPLAVALSCPSENNVVKALGVTKMSDDNKFVVSPITGKNESFVDFLNTYPWDDDSANAIQNSMKYSPQINSCFHKGGKLQKVDALSRYPEEVKVYEEPDMCATRKSRKG